MTPPQDKISATYEVRCPAKDIEARAKAIAIEQSVELPLEAFDDQSVHDGIVGQVRSIKELTTGSFRVDIALAAATAPPEAGQLLNVLFGNTSLQDDVRLVDIELPQGHLQAFGGPRQGLHGLRAICGAEARALTATALKPQGVSAGRLADIARRLALGGVDIIKDDHGLADQVYSPFAARVAACAAAVRTANASTGRSTQYAPSLYGTLDDLRVQLQLMREEGLRVALVSPMIIGLPSFTGLRREAADLAFLAHPSMGGAARIAPPLLIGRLFRLFGADATIFPNYGGRFSYDQATSRAIAERALEPWGGLQQTAPAPAGGMTLTRVPELLDFYGRDCILLIGGSLLAERENMTDAARAFQKKVEDHGRQAGDAKA